MCIRRFLVPVVLLAICICFATSQGQQKYVFCDTDISNVININVGSPPIFIYSPSYDIDYHDNDKSCSLVIRSGKKPLILFLHFNMFDLEYEKTCYISSLCIHGVKFCGEWLSGKKYAYILPENSFFTLHFATYHPWLISGSQTQFALTVTTQLAVNQRIEEVTRGIGSNAGGIYKTAKTYQPGFYYTDRCSQAQLVYYLCDTSTSNVVNINTTSPRIVIRSPNYGGIGSYNNLLRCSLILRSERVPLILSLRHNFNAYDLENVNDFGYDYFCVHGVMFWEAAKTFEYILPENSSFTLTFKTDGYVIRSGFQIEVSHELATSIDGVHNYSTVNSSVIYYFGHRDIYRDGCSSEDNPIDYSPESNTTITGAHDTIGPDTAAPVTTEPDTARTDTSESHTAGPDTTEPDTDEPDTTGSDTSEPDTARPDTAEPDTAEPDTAEPDTAEPDTTGPDTTELHTAGLDTTEPDSAGPDTAGPDTAGPDTAEPDTAEPDTAEPDTAEPDTAEPGTAEPDTAGPDTAESHTTELHTAGPDTTEADTAETDTAETVFSPCRSTNFSTNVDEVEAALVEAINSLNRARALLRQQN